MPPGAPGPPVKKSGIPGWAIALIVIGVLLVLGVGGCVFAVNRASDSISEAVDQVVDETNDGVVVGPGTASEEYLAEASCRVTGVDDFDDYQIELTVENPTSEPVDYTVVVRVVDTESGDELGSEALYTFFAPPGEAQTDEQVTFIDASIPAEGATCEVTEVRR